MTARQKPEARTGRAWGPISAMLRNERRAMYKLALITNRNRLRNEGMMG